MTTEAPRTEALSRAELIFRIFDANGNGVLEEEDFALMADRVTGAVPGAAPDRVAAMNAAFQRYWNTIVGQLDANGDGVISVEEFNACVLAPEQFDGAIGEFAVALSNLADLDGDGRVARPVFTGLMAAFGFEPGGVQQLFDALGPDGDDRITAASWDDAIRELYRPDVAATPGNLLVTRPAA